MSVSRFLVVDRALCRRFGFVEFPPEPAGCPAAYDGLNVRMFLELINGRIEFLRSREHRIGHAELMEHKLEAVRTGRFDGQADAQVKAFAWTLRHKILPLLLEYFPEDWRRAHAVLGRNALINAYGPPPELAELVGEEVVVDLAGEQRYSLPNFWDPESAAWSTNMFLSALQTGNAGVVLSGSSASSSG